MRSSAWRPTHPDDLPEILSRVQPAQREQIESGPDLSDPELLELTFRTFLVADRPEALFGVLLLWRGCARGVGLLTPVALEHPLVLTLGLRREIERAMEAFQLRRLEVTVEEQHEAAQRWAAALGFQPEGLMRYYGPAGNHHWLYARIREA